MQFRKFHAIAGAMALVAFGAAVRHCGSREWRARARTSRSRAGHLDPDQAPGRDLRRERVLRPLLRHLPHRREPARRAEVPRRCWHPDSERPVRQRDPGPAGPLLTSNPNGSNPLRIPPNDPMTCDQDHGYTHEQSAADHGAEDAYPASVGHSLTLTQCLSGFNFNGSPETVPAGGRQHAGRARLLRRQHGHRVVELRAALRDERQHCTARITGRLRPAR